MKAVGNNLLRGAVTWNVVEQLTDTDTDWAHGTGCSVVEAGTVDKSRTAVCTTNWFRNSVGNGSNVTDSDYCRWPTSCTVNRPIDIGNGFEVHFLSYCSVEY